MNPSETSRALTLRLLAGCALAVIMASPSLAQTDADDPTEVEEIVVTPARNQPGAVIGDITPELQLSSRDIRAYGVSSVSELIDALAPQTSSGRGSGRPVILVNGGRISGFQEIRDLPTEAILRVDILPEEVALKYGYPADQRVVNLVLRPRFRALTAEGSYTTPTQAGGGQTTEAHANLLRILRGSRMFLDVKATDKTQLLESDRDVAGRTDGAFRTLGPDTHGYSLNGVYTRPFDNGVSTTLNATLDKSQSDSLLGLSPLTPTALQRHSESTDGHLGAAANGAVAGWRWSYTGSLDSSDAKNTTQRAISGLAYTDRSRSKTTSASSDVVLNRAFLQLPAGKISTALTARVTTLEFESNTLRAGVNRGQSLSRDSGEVQANIDVPLTKRGGESLGFVGDLSANFNGAVENLSDFGDLTTVGYGLNWSPIKPVRFLASFTREDGAPTVNQLGDPEVVTPGVSVFDLSRGETATINLVQGGSRNLDSESKRVIKLGLTLKPWDARDLTFTANYISTRTDNVIAAFPSASTQVEFAFPDRFVRDATGRLVQIDSRPVNFDEQSRDELRYGFTYRKSLGPQRPAGGFGGGTRGDGRQGAQGQAAAAPAGQVAAVGGPPDGGPPPESGPPPGGFGGGGGGFGGPGGGGGGFRGGRGGRGGVFQIGVYHTIAFKDEIQIRPGLPTLDLLDGAAIGSGGGSPRHQVDVQANLTKNGLGANLNAKWQSSTLVRGSAAGSSDDLKFSDLTTVNLRLFADIGQQPFARGKPWLRGSRVSLSINNLFDSRQDVRTPSGTIPVSYQPDLLDPIGRSVKLNFRKLFF